MLFFSHLDSGSLQNHHLSGSAEIHKWLWHVPGGEGGLERASKRGYDVHAPGASSKLRRWSFVSICAVHRKSAL